MIENLFRDCEQFSIGQDTKVHWLEGSLIKVPKNSNFQFDYMLFIPNHISSDCTFIVEGSNVTYSTDNIKRANDVILESGLYPSLPIYNIASELGLPVLYPLFPRIYNGTETICNHMLATNSLDIHTPMLKELGLERVDLQLIEMFLDAKKRLEGIGIKVDEKFIIDGFSASAKFANRFTILHPEYVTMCIAGGVSGVLTLPLEKYQQEKLLWPVGLGNIKELIGQNISEEQLKAFKDISQFYYMGDQDTENNPFVFDELGEARYKGIVNTKELIQINQIFGSDILLDRWKFTQKIYRDLGVNALFKTYDGYGHDPRPAYDDMKRRIIDVLNLSVKKSGGGITHGTRNR